jgi:hypothetical protein
MTSCGGACTNLIPNVNKSPPSEAVPLFGCNRSSQQMYSHLTHALVYGCLPWQGANFICSELEHACLSSIGCELSFHDGHLL